MNPASTADWDNELARTGQVRFPPRRRTVIYRLMLNALPLLVIGGPVASALRGNRPWGFWEIFCLVWLAFIGFTATQLIWLTSTGRPLLIVDHEGVALDDQRLSWQEIRSIEGPPVRYFQGSRKLTVLPRESSRHKITILADQVEYLDTFGRWLSTHLHHHQHPTN